MDKLREILAILASQKFYGELLIKFEEGKVKIIKKTESIKP